MIDSKNTQQLKKFKVLLIGDSCIDEYYYGTCDRLNPEAPVPVLNITHQHSSVGMAANVKANLEAFGIDVNFITGEEKSIKRRYIDERSKQHIVRVDDDKINAPFDPDIQSINYNQYNSIVISDYNKGFVTYENVKFIRQQFNGPIFIDSKKPDIAQFQGCYLKINEVEYNKKISDHKELIVTLGRKGAQYKNQCYPTRQAEVVDVCGAGDTFLSALTYDYLKSKDIEHAIQFANHCASISVEHQGVYTLTKKDIDSIII